MLHLNLIHHACLEKVHRNSAEKNKQKQNEKNKNIQLKLTYIILTINFTLDVCTFLLPPCTQFFTLHLDKKLRLLGASLNHRAVTFH